MPHIVRPHLDYRTRAVPAAMSMVRLCKRRSGIQCNTKCNCQVWLEVRDNFAFRLVETVQTGGDSNDKPTAMQSRSIARSQCWTTVSKRIRSLSTLNVNSTGNNQPWKKPAVGSQPRSVLTFQDLRLSSTLLGSLPTALVTCWTANQVVYWVSLSPQRWGWILVGIPQQALFQGWLFPAL